MKWLQKFVNQTTLEWIPYLTIWLFYSWSFYKLFQGVRKNKEFQNLKGQYQKITKSREKYNVQPVANNEINELLSRVDSRIYTLENRLTFLQYLVTLFPKLPGSFLITRYQKAVNRKKIVEDYWERNPTTNEDQIRQKNQIIDFLNTDILRIARNDRPLYNIIDDNNDPVTIIRKIQEYLEYLPNLSTDLEQLRRLIEGEKT